MPEPVLSPESSPALASRSKYYPTAWEGRVPRRVAMRETVRPDYLYRLTEPRHRDLAALIGEEYDAWVNVHGAVSALVGGTALGLKPGEFEVIAWHGEA